MLRCARRACVSRPQLIHSSWFAARRQKSVDIEVDLWRFEVGEEQQRLAGVAPGAGVVVAGAGAGAAVGTSGRARGGQGACAEESGEGEAEGEDEGEEDEDEGDEE